MADYREISQGYAHQGINAAFLINGGAAIALLSQASDLREGGLGTVVATAMLIWAAGTLLASATWLLAFVSTRYVDKSEREEHLEEAHLARSNAYMMASVITVMVSLGLFAAGCAALSFGFL
ncbi:hypothetical protein [Pararhizobium gei]|uniref:hypothetical protein n=1 Tax=Pararhizobium gei TaxID=1395951 RepID=UPI0023D9C43D|nr:hypothetical protein [Rhizobium gei]